MCNAFRKYVAITHQLIRIGKFLKFCESRMMLVGFCTKILGSVQVESFCRE